MTRLTVLYDARCAFCRRCCWWLGTRRQLLGVEFVPAASPRSRERFPALRQASPPEELIVIDDAGGVYRGADAWIMCLAEPHGAGATLGSRAGGGAREAARRRGAQRLCSRADG